MCDQKHLSRILIIIRSAAAISMARVKSAPDISPWDWKEGSKNTVDFLFRPKLPPGLQLHFDSDSSVLDFFTAYISEDMLKSLVTQTNLFARQKKYKWKYGGKLTLSELKKFIGLTLAMGITRQPSLIDYWTKEDIQHMPFFSKIMSKNRFKEISQFLHVNDNSMAPEPGSPDDDKLFKIRPFLDEFTKNCQQNYVPYQNLSLDEGTVGFKGQVSFKCYNPNKPEKFHVKLYEVCCAKTGMLVNLEIYAGKQQVTSIKGACYDQVMRLLDPLFLDQGYRIFMDNYYSAPVLFLDLLKRLTAACGTLRKNRTGVPQQIKTAKLDKGDRLVMHLPKSFDEDTARLHIVLWKDKRDVLLLSSAHDGSMVQHRNKRGIVRPKPVIVLKYNKGMGAVDRNDQLTKYYQYIRRTLKWYRKVLFQLFSMAIVNAYIAYKLTVRKPMTHKKFRLALIHALVGSKRQKSTRQIPVTRSPLLRLHERHFPSRIDSDNADKRRICVVCSSVSGKRDKPGAQKRSQKSAFECSDCDVGLCIDPCFKLYHTEHDYKDAYKALRLHNH